MKLSQLFEAISLKDAKKYTKLFKPEMYEKLFAKYENTDRKKYRIYLDFDNLPDIDAPEEIKSAVRSSGYEIEDYRVGIAVDSTGKRRIKIGKLLKEPDVKKIFDNDKNRNGSKSSDLMMVISRHPVDIAGMSTDRGWTSCMNLEDGRNKKYVAMDVEHGSLVAYCINSDDTNINNPIARIMIKPFIDITNEKNILLGAEDKVYGSAPTGFKKSVLDWVDEVNTGKTGVFKFDDKLYKDSDDSYRYKFDENAPEDDQIEAVKKLGYAIKHIKNPSEAVQIAAVKQDGYTIQYIKNPSEAVQMAAVQKDGSAIRYIKNPSESVQLAATRKDAAIIKFIENPSEDVKINAVKQTGYYIEHIKNPSEDVKIAAVKQTGWAIEYIENPSEAVQIAAAEQNGHAIKYIKNPSEDIKIVAVKKDGSAIKYIKNPSEAVQMVAVKQYCNLIQYIKNPSEAVQIAAVKQDRYTIQYIKNPSEKVKQYAKE